MIRGSALGRLVSMGLGGRFHVPPNRWAPLARRFGNGEDDPTDQMEIIDEDGSGDFTKGGKGKSVEYQFYSKNIALVVENPLFPYNNKIIHLGKYHSKLLNTKMPSFVTCILRKDVDAHLAVDAAADKAKDGQASGPTLKGKGSTDDFYSLGTYCSVQYNKDTPHKISVKGIHKVNIKNVQEYALAYEQENNLEEFSGLLNEVSQDEPREEEQSPAKTKEENKTMEQFLRNSIQVMRDTHKKPFDDTKFYISEIEKVFNQKVQLTVEERAKLDHMIELSKKIMTIHNMNFLQDTPLNFNDIEIYLDFYAAFVLRSKFFTREEILPTFLERSVPERLQHVHALMKKYHLLMTNMTEIGKITQKNMQARHSKEFYHEMSNVVQNLSEGGKKNKKYIDRLNNTFANKKPPKHVQELFSENLKRLMNATQESSEINTLKNYLDWVVSMPYGVKSEDNLDIPNVRKQLDSDHYGLNDVKDRILEFVAVGKMRNSVKEKILLLQGPPGVGKTSLAESIAKALGRSYDRISLGGESDSSVLKGHRRTYIGAYPGKIITALKKCGTENCVIILDEIDKLGASNHHGDPQSNLLEILDPAQNKSFVDNYMDFPIDLSNVLFICTANTLSTISAPLLDRMDVINLSSYTNVEKKFILDKHLLPKAITEAGLKEIEYFELGEGVVEKLINDYCREPGVRSLERHAKKIADKVAFKVVSEREKDPEAVHEKINVTKENLKTFIGNALFDKEQIYATAPPGVAVGLAYTQMGGSILFLEAKKASFTRDTTMPGIKYTGTLGSVMSESVKIAYTFARNYLQSKGNHFLEKNDIHIHAPEGAIPKDGPSAGITIATALISLATQTPVKPKLGMTGELSLNGKVMKIGGVKEKTLAGKREGLTELIFPKDNQVDVEDLKDYIKEGMTFKFVGSYEEAKDIIFPS